MEINSTKSSTGRKILGIVGKVLSFIAKAIIFLTRKFIEYFFNIIITLLLIIIVTGGIVATTFAIYIRDNIDASFDLSDYVSTLNQTSTIYYTDYKDLDRTVGVEKELGEIKSRINRTWATIDASESSDEALIIPEHVVNAFVAVEDKRFFNHSGVDWLRTGSAVISFATTFKMSYGGSTITQQLIKNLTGEDDATIQRKLQEILRALYLERALEEEYADYENPKYETKKQIIETYLNTIFLSQSAYGVQAASQTYFSKDVSELTLVEAAALAAIPQNPYKWNPASKPENNKERRNTVLKRMYDQEMISEEEYRDAINTNLEINLNTQESSMNSYFVDYMIDSVTKDLAAEYGYSETIAEQLIYGGGLQIYATLDPEIQNIIEEEYCNDKNFPTVGDGIMPQSAMVIIDPYTGYLLGMVGGRGEKEGSVLNRAASSKRQPGSTIKPIAAYAPAIDKKLITWGTVIDDTPVEFNGNTPWPNNANMRFRGLTTVKYALQQSLNTIAVKVVEMLKPEESFRFLTEELGITTLIESKESANGTIFSDIGLSPLALGGLTYGAHLVELTAAYSIFPNDGIFSKCCAYTKVVDKEGNVILSNEIPEQSEVISSQTATIMNVLLQNVVTNGTGAAVTLDKKIQTAGKTGTTSDKKDLWFVGYTPYLLAGAWYGYDTPKRINSTGNPALVVWDKVMNRVHDELILPAIKSGEEIKKSFKSVKDTGGIATVQYCIDSGCLPTAACYNDIRGDRVETGYFISGTQPKKKCEVHVNVKYDSVTKAVACENCPPENIKTVSLIHVDREFPVYIAVEDAQYTWRKVGESFEYAEREDQPFYYGLRTFNIKIKNFYYGIGKDIEKPLNRICTEHLNAPPPTVEPDVPDVPDEPDSGGNGGNGGNNGGGNGGGIFDNIFGR